MAVVHGIGSCTLWFVMILFAQGNAGFIPADLMRAAKCVIPNGKDHVTRAALLQQCLSENYAQGNETQCYEELGCMPMEYPWVSLVRPLPTPEHPAEIDTRIYCYNRDSSQRYNTTLWPKISLGGFPFQADRVTMFLTHGFSSDGNTTWMANLKDQYLKQVDANVCLVDWGKGAQLLNYLQVASNTRVVGAELARFIRQLISEHKLNSSQVHLIGHSLGAHICSYAAKNVTKVGRLTALDPAQPGFEGTPKAVRLDRSDAEHVDVVHTNAAPFLPTLGFGLIMPAGDVDIYMNGGVRQPGCAIPDITEIKSIADLAKFPVEFISQLVSCSHGRAYEYFTEALEGNCTIWGRLSSLGRHVVDVGTFGLTDAVVSTVETCDSESCIPLGLQTPEYEARGIFSANTPKRSPFCSDPEENTKILSDIFESSARKAKDVSKEVKSKAKDALELGVKTGSEVKDMSKEVKSKAKDALKAGVETGSEAKDVSKEVKSKAKDAVKVGVQTGSGWVSSIGKNVGNVFTSE